MFVSTKVLSASMQRVPVGKGTAAEVQRPLQVAERNPAGALVVVVLGDQAGDLVADQAADRRGTTGGQDPGLLHGLLVELHGEIAPHRGYVATVLRGARKTVAAVRRRGRDAGGRRRSSSPSPPEPRRPRPRPGRWR